MLLVGLLTAAFPLEFFSMARGYAMSIAFLMGAVHNTTQYLKTQELKYQLRLWFWMWLAVSASLTLLNSYIIVLGLAMIGIIRLSDNRAKHLMVMLCLGLSFFAAAALYAFDLKERGLLYTGLADGFIEVTVRSLVEFQFDQESAPIANATTLVGALSAIYLIVNLIRSSLKWNAVSLVAVMLFLNAVGSITLNLLFGMNFPENRVGMYFIPLFLITVAGALDGLAERFKQVKWIALSFLFFPIHLGKHFNFNSTILWPRWHASYLIYDTVVEEQAKKGETLMVSGEYLNELGWAYYNFQNNAELQLLQRDPVPDTLADFIIARPADFEFESIPYKAFLHDEANDVYLLRRETDLNWSSPQAATVNRTDFNGSDEFYELLNDSVSNLPNHFGIWELTGTLKSKEGLFDGQLIFTSSGPKDSDGTYNMIPLHWIRPTWNNDTLHIKRTFYFSPNATNVKVYFWNLNRQEFNFKLNKMEFSSIE
jgi:hypothetical protein